MPPAARSMPVALALADLYSRAGRFGEAINLLTRITQRFPNFTLGLATCSGKWRCRPVVPIWRSPSSPRSPSRSQPTRGHA